MTPRKPTARTRRQFHRDLALAAGAVMALPGTSTPADDNKPDKGDELFALIEARYGKHLEPEQLAEIKKALQRDRGRADYLRRFPLRNSDEPAFVFRADC